MMSKCLLAVLTFALLAGGASAQMPLEPKPSSEGRPCLYADVIGLWDSRVIRVDEKGAAELYAILTRDYLRVRPDGGMMYYGTNTPETDVAAIEAQLDTYDRMDGVTYTAEVPIPGVFQMRRDGKGFQGFTCTVVEPKNKKPSFLLTELKGMPALRRVQVRMD